MSKDFGLILRLAESLSVAMPAAAVAKQIDTVEQARRPGREEDFSAGFARSRSCRASAIRTKPSAHDPRLCRRYRQREGEHTAPADPAGHGDAPAVSLHNVLGDGETKTRAAGVPAA